MAPDHALSRRQFIGTAAAAGAFAVLPRHVLGGPEHTAPSDRLNMALIGSGTMALNMLMSEWLPREDLHISCVCDPNTATDDYVDWSEHGLRNRIREFLDDPDWADGVDGILAGREVGLELVRRHYARTRGTGDFSGITGYADFRELLEREEDIDGVIIMTPEHLHATIGIAAMEKGKHAISHKTLSNRLAEVRLAADTARRHDDVVTHLMAWINDDAYYQVKQLIGSNVIGDVREVHNWSLRPMWPQGWLHNPVERPPVPNGMDWDLWLGPVPHRPYHPAYTHALFRGWIDFGSGSLGDMGNYSLWKIYRILGLGTPERVVASPTTGALVVDQTSGPRLTQVAHPHSSTIRFYHGAGEGHGPVEVVFYDGGRKPDVPQPLKERDEILGREGMLIVGSNGFILGGYLGENPRVFVGGREQQPQFNPEMEPQDANGMLDGTDEWIAAVREGRKSRGSFENVQPLAEATCLGSVGNLVNGRVDFDVDAMKITNNEEANRHLFRAYRAGWELAVPS